MKSASGKTFDTLNPATGEPIAQIQEGIDVCFVQFFVLFFKLCVHNVYYYSGGC